MSKVFHSIISAEALKRQLTARYAITETAECLMLARGINDSYLLVSGNEKRVARIYRAGWRTRAEIDAEVHLIEYVAACGMPVSVPIADMDGIYIQTIDAPEGLRYAVLFSYAEGRPLDRTNPGEWALLGRFAGEFHRVGAKMQELCLLFPGRKLPSE